MTLKSVMKEDKIDEWLKSNNFLFSFKHCKMCEINKRRGTGAETISQVIHQKTDNSLATTFDHLLGCSLFCFFFITKCHFSCLLNFEQLLVLILN